METVDRASSLSRSTVARRRCLIKNVTSWELVRETSLFGVSFYNLNFLPEKAKEEETFFLHVVKASRK